MRTLMTLAAAAACCCVGFAATGLAEVRPAPPHYVKAADFAEVLQDVKDAIVNRGYVIDFVGHVDKMLENTSAAVGSVTPSGTGSPYLNAKYVQFCSAKLTHRSVSANPFNIAICPYVVFVFEARTERLFAVSSG